MRKNIIITTMLFTVLTVVTITGCYYDREDLLYPSTPSANCTTVPAKFSTDIDPLIQSKCATSGCHDAATGAGNAILVTYTQISAQAARINQRCVIDKTMPTSGPLTADEIAALTCWINSGTPNN